MDDDTTSVDQLRQAFDYYKAAVAGLVVTSAETIGPNLKAAVEKIKADGKMVTVVHGKPSVIVWDLETVPDLSGFAPANDLIGKSNVEVRRRSVISFQSISTTQLCASELSSRTGSPITGRWTPLARPMWARGQRSS